MSSNVRFNWLSTFTKISTWLTIVSVCHTVTLKILTNTLTMTKCGKMLKACWNQPWMTWNSTTLKQKVKLPSTVQNLISKWRLPLVMKKHFLLSNWTSCFQNALTLNTSELMGKNTVQLWFTVGLSQQWNALQLSLLKTIKEPSQLGWHLNK